MEKQSYYFSQEVIPSGQLPTLSLVQKLGKFSCLLHGDNPSDKKKLTSDLPRGLTEIVTMAIDSEDGSPVAAAIAILDREAQKLAVTRLVSARPDAGEAVLVETASKAGVASIIVDDFAAFNNRLRFDSQRRTSTAIGNGLGRVVNGYVIEIKSS